MPAGTSRVALAAVVAAGALVTVGPEPSAAAGSDDRLRVGTFNIDRDRGFASWRRVAREFRRHVDVAGMQEVDTASKRRFLERSAGWDAYGVTPGRDDNPVIWDRSEFRKVGARAARIAKKQGRFATSYATVVRLVHRATGQRYTVLNVHLLHGAFPHGRKKPGRHDRHRFYVTQVRGLARAVAHEKARGDVKVVVVGDFNVDHADDRRLRHPRLPTARLRDQGLESAWDIRESLPHHAGTSTAHAGHIDNVWAEGRPRSIRAIDRISGGQHHPVVATY